MRNRFIKFGNSSTTLLCVLTILISLIMGKFLGRSNLYNFETGFYIIAGISTLVWIVCLMFVLWGNKDIKAMSKRPRILLETVCSALFLVWTLIALGPIETLIWLPFVIWNLFRSYKRIYI